jgi:hypothetical protein
MSSGECRRTVYIFCFLWFVIVVSDYIFPEDSSSIGDDTYSDNSSLRREHDLESYPLDSTLFKGKGLVEKINTPAEGTPSYPPAEVDLRMYVSTKPSGLNKLDSADILVYISSETSSEVSMVQLKAGLNWRSSPESMRFVFSDMFIANSDSITSTLNSSALVTDAGAECLISTAQVSVVKEAPAAGLFDKRSMRLRGDNALVGSLQSEGCGLVIRFHLAEVDLDRLEQKVLNYSIFCNVSLVYCEM